MSVSLQCSPRSFGSTRLTVLCVCVEGVGGRGAGRDVIWRISRWPPWLPSWKYERNDFSNSESLCRCNASHQVSTQSNLGFGRRCRLKNFKMANVGYRNGTLFKKFWISMSLRCLPSSLDSIWLTVSEDMLFEEWISSWPPWQMISERNNFSNSESLRHSDSSHRVSTQSDLEFGRRCRLKNFKMAAVLDIGTEQF